MSETPQAEPREEIAIVGMAGRFPGAADVEAFWHNLRSGVESIRPFSTDELRGSGVDEVRQRDPAFVNAGAVMDDADAFDAGFFGISAREAEIMDPQHRAFLECAWATLEDAGYDPETYDGLIGIFGGVAPNTYFQHNLTTRRDILEMVGPYPVMLASEKDYAITRVAFKLNLKGPCFNVNTACSTSAVALHLASQSVMSGECDLALVGGARIRVPLKAGYVYQEDGILSPDGHCRAFDADARGTVVGNGIAMIAIKRLSDALRDGDSISALVKGTAINNDGAQKVGFTAPSVRGQTAVIREALAMADVDPDTVGYVEAHGTGTSLGDPIEVTALSRAYRETTRRTQYCGIGSVKTNIGHLDAGAGVTGIIKAALAVQHGEIPPSLHFTKPNPQIDFQRSPFYVVDRLTPWPRNAHPRRAGVSSFGLGGTNAHVILEEAPEIPAEPSRAKHHVLLLSAKTETALEAASDRLARSLRSNPHQDLADIAFTLQVGRRRFAHRRMISCASVEEAASRLRKGDPKHVSTHADGGGPRSVVFSFPGGGTQYAGMAARLYQREGHFRRIVDQCADPFQTHVGSDLREVLFPQNADGPSTDLRQRPSYGLPALFAMEYALASLWQSWGVTPAGMIGHGIGEYAAACLAGTLALDHAMALAAFRGRLCEELADGVLLSIPLSEEQIREHLTDDLSLAAINAPSRCVVSGSEPEMDGLQRRLADRGIETSRLNISVPHHKRLSGSVLDEFAELLKTGDLRAPRLRWISNVTGTWIEEADAVDPDYWVNQLTRTVRFSDGIAEIWNDPEVILLEVGPGATLSVLAQQHPSAPRAHAALASFGSAAPPPDEVESMVETIGRLWLGGAQIDWFAYYRNQRRRRISLPTYPFERKPYWIEPASIAAAPPDGTATSTAPKTPEESTFANAGSQSTDDSRSRPDRIKAKIKEILRDLSGMELAAIEEDATFLELGFDSLLLTQANTVFHKTFEVHTTFRQLFEDAPSVRMLAEYIDRQLPEDAPTAPAPSPGQGSPIPESAAATAPAPSPADPGHLAAEAPAEVEKIIDEQLRAMARQLDLLEKGGRRGNGASQSGI